MYVDSTIQLVNNIIQLSGANDDPESARAGIQLLIVMIETLKGKIDNIFEHIISFILSNISNNNLRLSILELVI
jgi:hypothetical protein